MSVGRLPVPAASVRSSPPPSGPHTPAGRARRLCAIPCCRASRSTVPCGPALPPRSCGSRRVTLPPSDRRQLRLSGRLGLPPDAARRPASIPVSSVRWLATPPTVSNSQQAVFVSCVQIKRGFIFMLQVPVKPVSRSDIEAIPQSAQADDVSRLRRILLDLASQVIHVGVDHTIGKENVFTPDDLDQPVQAQNRARMLQ